MRSLLIIVFLSLSCATAFGQSTNRFFKKADQFFARYVENGKVAYQEIKQDPEMLNELVSMIGGAGIEGKSDHYRLAFYINAYNILTINEVIDHYPVTSPRDVSGFFDEIKHQVAGKDMTLNQLENQKIRTSGDPRIHFAVVCAARGCPAIVDFSYKPSRLDKQLDAKTRQTLNDDYYVRVKDRSEKVLLSEIFKWYKEDFINGDTSLISYVNQYREDTIPADYEVGYYPYNWHLNGKKK